MVLAQHVERRLRHRVAVPVAQVVARVVRKPLRPPRDERRAVFRKRSDRGPVSVPAVGPVVLRVERDVRLPERELRDPRLDARAAHRGVDDADRRVERLRDELGEEVAELRTGAAEVVRLVNAVPGASDLVAFAHEAVALGDNGADVALERGHAFAAGLEIVGGDGVGVEVPLHVGLAAGNPDLAEVEVREDEGLPGCFEPKLRAGLRGLRGQGQGKRPRGKGQSGKDRSVQKHAELRGLLTASGEPEGLSALKGHAGLKKVIQGDHAIRFS